MIENAPDMPEVGGDAAAALEQRHASRGIDIDSKTNMPTWDGLPIDYGMAVDGLTPF